MKIAGQSSVKQDFGDFDVAMVSQLHIFFKNAMQGKLTWTHKVNEHKEMEDQWKVDTQSIVGGGPIGSRDGGLTNKQLLLNNSMTNAQDQVQV